MNEPIIALATPPLKSALAMIRASGEGILEITDSLFSKPVSNLKTRSLLYGTLSDQGQAMDEVVLLVYPKPHTMTGEDIVEICCHGSMVIVNQIVEAYLSRGVRYATGGEFSARAFYNGKMDLIEAEAVQDLINATTVESKNVALLSLSGQTSKSIGPLKEEIGALLGLVEVGIDFPEYDEEEAATNQGIAAGCHAIRERISTLLKQGEEGRMIREGVKLALVGKPNVGKSSLLNALLQKEKAIVSDIPGTTRDVVEGDLSINGIPVHLMDTAGIRESNDAIEQLGVKRSLSSIEEADLVLFVHDASTNYDEEERELLKSVENKPYLIVNNKADLIAEKNDGEIEVSALHNDIGALKKAIVEKLGIHDSAYHTPSLSSARELALLRLVDSDLKEAEEGANNGLSVDLLSVSLQEAYNHVRELLGEDATHDLTDEIFSRFCVGK